jgi:lysophospholipase L1-like esterase
MKRIICFLLCFASFLTGLGRAEESVALPVSDEGLPGAGPIRRAEWFQNVWTKRRSAWAASAEADQGAVVFLGDSITQGWGDDFRNAFPGMKTANRGISGDTTRGMLFRLEADVLALHPKGVVLLLGTNDLEEGAAPEVITGNLKLILAALKAHRADLPVVLCLVMPSSASKKRPAEAIRKINELYAAAVKGDPQVTVVDTWTLFADAAGDAPESEFPDRLHLNEAGYARWAAALRPIFATLGYLETEADPFQPEEGFVSLFNGRDLSGWGFRPMPGKPKGNAKAEVTEAVSFDGQTASNDGRYVAINGRLVVTTPPEGRRIQQLWTTREFPRDFILKLEFRATPNADSGVFIRQPQLQCRDYRLAGPYKDLRHYRSQEWNELVVTVKGGEAHATCNGDVLESALAVPPTGPIGLEGDRGQMEYRRIRIRELP